MKYFPLLVLPLLLILLTGCHAAPVLAPGGVDPNDPATVLPDFAKAHDDKISFAGFVKMPLIHSVDPAVKEFAASMEADHKRLLARLSDWAKKNKASLKYTYSAGLPGTSLKSMEEMQSDLIQADSSADFQRDYLILTWTDLDWQRNLAKAALAHVKDPELKAYLQDSLTTQTKEREQCRVLLARYKW